MTTPVPPSDPYQPDQPSSPPPPPPPGQYGYPAGSMPYAAGPTHEPLTGLPYSDKSKTTAGLLQLLLGAIIGLGGVGRLYAGQTGMGITQVALSVVGWISFWCGFVLVIPFFIFFGLWVWFVVDGIIMLAGRPLDGQGRPLR